MGITLGNGQKKRRKGKHIKNKNGKNGRKKEREERKMRIGVRRERQDKEISKEQFGNNSVRRGDWLGGKGARLVKK